MGQESAIHYNNEILVGFTDKRGSEAWHYRFDLQNMPGGTVNRLGLANNHFTGPIPLDVAERFFDTTFSAREVFIRSAITGLLVPLANYRAWCNDENDSCAGIHSDGFQGHQYKPWLYDNVLGLVNGTTGMGSVGYLRDKAIAFASIEMPENIKTPEGVEFRPWLMATTGFNGTLATTYKRGKTFPLCDNTMEALLREIGQEYKIKHTSKSTSEYSIRNAQEALAILEKASDEDAAEIAELCSRKVTEAQFQAFLAKLVPLPEISSKDVNARDHSTRSATIAAKKREALNELYKIDGRAAPWQGTVFGVLQAVNTYNQHFATVRNTNSRFARNMENTLNGKSGAADLATLKTLELVCV